MGTPIIRVDDTKLQSWLRQEPEREAESLRLFQEEGSLLVMAEMRQQVPIRTGFLRESITTNLTPQGFTVYPSAPYAKAVEEGVGPHTIFPVRAKVLRFETEAGAIIFTKYVKHPGFPGRFFVRRTAEIVRERLAELMRQILGRVYAHG
jgi:hypothetical protein